MILLNGETWHGNCSPLDSGPGAATQDARCTQDGSPRMGESPASRTEVVHARPGGPMPCAEDAPVAADGTGRRDARCTHGSSNGRPARLHGAKPDTRPGGPVPRAWDAPAAAATAKARRDARFMQIAGMGERRLHGLKPDTRPGGPVPRKGRAGCRGDGEGSQGRAIYAGSRQGWTDPGTGCQGCARADAGG